MSHGSYYEIALTNRQVVTAFVILLMCVVVAFLAGVWVGHEANAGDGVDIAQGQAGSGGRGGFRFFGGGAEEPEPGSEPDVQQVVPSLPAATPAPTQTPAPRDSLRSAQENAQKNDRKKDQKSTPKDPEQGDRRTSSLPPVAGALSGAPASKPAEAGEAAAAASGGEKNAEKTPESPETPESTAESKETADQSAEVTPAKPKTVDPPPMSELTVIQVFSTADESQARAVLGRLKDGGYRAFLSPVQVDGKTMYRVRVGPFADVAVAEDQAQELKTTYKLDTWITH